MEEKRFDAAESLALIERMIENTRNDMERNAGRPFLVWGYVTLLTTLLVWGTVVQTGEPRWNLLWLLIPLLNYLVENHGIADHGRRAVLLQLVAAGLAVAGSSERGFLHPDPIGRVYLPPDGRRVDVPPAEEQSHG